MRIIICGANLKHQAPKHLLLRDLPVGGARGKGKVRDIPSFAEAKVSFAFHRNSFSGERVPNGQIAQLVHF